MLNRMRATFHQALDWTLGYERGWSDSLYDLDSAALTHLSGKPDSGMAAHIAH